MKTLTHEPATSSTLRLHHGAESTEDVVKHWHDETHTGPFWICQEQPCHAVDSFA